jgi:aryl-alcohol dehydrogenase-like predicted oxidoreductase
MKSMLKRTLGSTNLHISTVGLGVFAIGGWLWGQQDDGARNASQGAALADLAVQLTPAQVAAMNVILTRLRQDIPVEL